MHGEVTVDAGAHVTNKLWRDWYAIYAACVRCVRACACTRAFMRAACEHPLHGTLMQSGTCGARTHAVH